LTLFGVCAEGISIAESSSPNEVARAWHHRLDGVHFHARLTLAIDRGTHVEERKLSIWRDHDEGGERLMARFDSPFDLRGVALLYLEHANRSNDYFLYQPTAKRIRRIPEALAREDVYGVDLEYLGFGSAHMEPSRSESVTRLRREGRSLIELTERALGPNPRFDTRRVWLDPESHLVMRTEHVRSELTTLVARTLRVDVIDGIPTPTLAVFERFHGRDGASETSEVVRMSVEVVDYRSPIPDHVFSTFRLLRSR
jgi:hypothetical protein